MPNLLTLSRVGLAVAFFAVLTPWRYVASPLVGKPPEVDPWLVVATALFILAAVTDALDGHLARKWKVVTPFGRVMDPFADKVLVIGAFMYLAGPGFMMPWPWTVDPEDMTPRQIVRHLTIPVSGVESWMVVVILGRELLVTSIRAVVEGAGGSFAASWSGKAKMILQSVCIPAILVLVNIPQENESARAEGLIRWVIQGVVWATVVVTVWSAVPYITRAVRVLSRSQA